MYSVKVKSIPAEDIDWFVEYIDDVLRVSSDIIRGRTIQEAKRNLIAKTGIMDITFLEIKPCKEGLAKC